MGSRTVLGAQELETSLAGLAGWSLVGGQLHREFVFKDFSEAFAFMTRFAQAAESADHHPDWSNSYNRVTINLSTHSAGGITALDVALAKKAQDIGPAR
jgi:4a-hydroxytetrahydrobiopterin dehydratase